MQSKLYCSVMLFCLLMASSCRESVFTSKVEKMAEPEKTVELVAEKIVTDHLFSEYFAVFDTLLISSCPNSPEFIFYVSNIKNNKLIGSFMHRGLGPREYLGLTPIKRIERKGDDITALTYEPNKRQLFEWNITKSIEIGGDSILRLGCYKNPNEYGFTYSGMYRMGKKYLGYTLGYSFDDVDTELLLPTYWILDGSEIAPTHGISVVKNKISNDKSVILDDFFFSSAWSLSPDNSKVVDAMNWLQQINIIDLDKNNVFSYRVEDSPGESIFGTKMEHAAYQYHDVVCDDNSIYGLYFGEPIATYKDSAGCFWLHEFDWNGNFKTKYHLTVPILRIWLDSSSGILYGYCAEDDAIYKLI